MAANTLFLRLEAPLQAWGSHEAQFAVRRSAEAPTRSGVAGLLCAALGVSREAAAENWLPAINTLKMGVRIDLPGFRCWDYHTVGAGQRMVIADSDAPQDLTRVGSNYPDPGKPLKFKTKPETMLSRREYLADASFIVALQGNPELIAQLAAALSKPIWTIYLGRKSCPPSRPVDEHGTGDFEDLLSALASVPWRQRPDIADPPETLKCLLDWVPTQDGELVPPDAEIHHDIPISFDPPRHQPRFVISCYISLATLQNASDPSSARSWRPPRPRADYSNTQYRRIRQQRLEQDQGLCVFCKAPGTTVQHTTYRHAGGGESTDELRALCRLCHDAVTMLEYGSGMSMDRIDPLDPGWRDSILQKRQEIIAFRSNQQRQRALGTKEEQ